MDIDYPIKFAPDEELISISPYFITTNKNVYHSRQMSMYDPGTHYEASGEVDRYRDICLYRTRTAERVGITYKDHLMYVIDLFPVDLDDSPYQTVKTQVSQLYKSSLSGKLGLCEDYIAKNYDQLVERFEKSIETYKNKNWSFS